MCSGPVIPREHLSRTSLVRVRAAKGFDIGNAGWEHVIAVNQVGKRFYNETCNSQQRDRKSEISAGHRRHPQSFRADGLAQRQSRRRSRRSTRGRRRPTRRSRSTRGHRLRTSQSGPVWAIFDSAAVARGGWKLRYPYIADPPDGYFHKADTVAELAKKVTENAHQKMPLKYLEQTVTRYNAFADKGADEDFEKPVMHRIEHTAVLRRLDADRHARFLRRAADQRQGAGRRPLGRGHTRSVCRRRSQRRWSAAWSRPSHRSTVTSPGQMRPGRDDLSISAIGRSSSVHSQQDGPQTLAEKLWNSHEMVQVDGECLLYVDYLFLHEGARHAFDDLDENGRSVRRPEQVIACADHYVPTRDRSRGLAGIEDPAIRDMVVRLERNARHHQLQYYGHEDRRQGILHVVAPELGITQPGLLIAGADFTPPRMEHSAAWRSASGLPMRCTCWQRRRCGCASRSPCASGWTAAWPGTSRRRM